MKVGCQSKLGREKKRKPLYENNDLGGFSSHLKCVSAEKPIDSNACMCFFSMLAPNAVA